LVPTEATPASVDEAVTVETADDEIIATEGAEMPETLSEGASEAVEDVMNTAADTEMSEDDVDAAVMEETVASEGPALSSELAVSELPTEGLEDEPVEEDDPERSDERET
jgi:hypothetical protein